MPENLMNSAHKSNSDLYRANYERVFFKQIAKKILLEPPVDDAQIDKEIFDALQESRVGRIYPCISPFCVNAPRVVFNDKDYGVIAVNTHKDKKDA